MGFVKMNGAELFKELDFKEGYIDLKNFDKSTLSTLQRRAIKEVEKFDIDAIHFSGNFPIVYFKSITDFAPKVINEICFIQRRIWNQRQVPFLYVSSPMELRIYNCFQKPINLQDQSQDIGSIELVRASLDDRSRLNELIEVFGRVSLESGRFWKNKKYTGLMDARNRVDRTLMNSLKETRTELVKKNIDFKTVHKLLIRSLFILYLEDREAANSEFYGKYRPGAESYFDILDDKNATYSLFTKLEESFNGNLAPVTVDEKRIVDGSHLRLIKDCFWDGQKDTGRLFRWRAFDFSIIPIELISEIYEEFLKTETGEEQASKEGAYYTPLSLVEFILNEKLPWADAQNMDYNLKVIDPACGSGIFLVECYRRLVDRWKFCHKDQQIGFEDLKKILLDSIYGVEKNPEAIRVAAFSLYLAMLDYLEPRSLWDSARFPFLVSNPGKTVGDRQGGNLFCASSLSDGDFSNQEYDLVVGNPPFKRGGLEKEAHDYLKNNDFAQEYVLAFLHRATKLSPQGQIALVASSKILFNKTRGYRNFRNFLFNSAYVDAIYNFSILRKAKKKYGGQFIPSAVGPVCVIFYRSKKPDVSNERIIYCAPKSPVKRNMAEGVIIDSSDFKFLPREECARGDTNIWKVAMWASDRDYEIINRLSREKSLKDYFDSNRNIWHYGTGLHKSGDRKCYVENLFSFPLIPAKSPEIYYSNYRNLKRLGEFPPGERNFRKIKNKIFKAPYVIIKKGQKRKQFLASYVDFDSLYTTDLYGITADVEAKVLKALTAYANSKIALYCLFLTSSSWGVEREQVMLNEAIDIPAIPLFIPGSEIDKLAGKVDEIISLKKKNPAFTPDTSRIEKEIDELIYQALGLSERDRYLIEDTLRYGLGLFQDGEESEAYHLPTTGELESYAKILCDDINDLLQYSATTVWATIYEVRHDSPLNMVALRFSNRQNPGEVEKVSSQKTITGILKEIDRYTYEKFSQSVYFRKVVKYYQDDTIFIIKPNEKRFWSRSMAMSDADDMLSEVSRS